MGAAVERRPVAMRNAALSVRNLKRSLRVMEALGVNPNVGASKVIMGRVRKVKRRFGVLCPLIQVLIVLHVAIVV